METWFILAVLSAILGGFGAFTNKVTAHRKYSSQLVIIVNSLTSLLVFIPPALFFEGVPNISLQFLLVIFVAGILTSFTAIIKVEALHYIDSAIFLPLYKVFGPLFVIVMSILIFGESFNSFEWFGLIASLLVPILLISKLENSRQNNLTLGLILVIISAAVSAIIIGLQKFAIDIQSIPLWIISISSLGILVGSVVQYAIKHRGGMIESLTQNFSWGLLQIGLIRTVFAGGGFLLILYALSYGGPLGIVYTINSLYIIPPIILAIIFYNEHWNLRKALAVALSVLALTLL